MKLYFDRKILVVFVLTVIVLAALAIFSVNSTQRLLHTASLLSHGTRVITSADLIVKNIVEMETGQRGFVITGKDNFLEPLNESSKTIDRYIHQLDSLTGDSPTQQLRMDSLRSLVLAYRVWTDSVIDAGRADYRQARAMILTERGKVMTDGIRAVTRHIQKEEREAFLRSNTISRDSLKQFQYSFIGLALLITLIIVGLFYGINRSLRKRHAVERELKDTADMLQDLYDKSPCGYLSVDGGLRLTKANQTLLQWLGYEAPEMIGKMEFKDLLSSQSREAFLASFEKDFDNYKKAGHLEDQELYFQRKDGSVFPVILNSTAILDEQGNLVSSRSTISDNTERKKINTRIKQINQELEAKVEERTRQLSDSQRIYKAIVSHIPGSTVVIFDKEERYLLAEGDMLEHMGYDKEKMLTQKLSEVAPKASYDAYSVLLRKAFGGETISQEVRTASGADALMKIAPLRNDRDEIFAAMMVLIDISGIKKAQRELAELNTTLEKKVLERTEQLEAVNKELNAFTYSVSHDLRSPLRSITGFTEILNEDYRDKLDDEGKRLIDVIIANSTRMGQLIDDLLNFSKLGRQAMSLRSVDMDKLVRTVTEELLVHEKDRTVNIRQHALEGTTGDTNLLRQVWTNLVSNALKYSRKKLETQIEIGSYRKEGRLYYYIQDNGAGFDMQYSGKLFGVFQRLHKANEFEGTGVGLALVKNIVNRHQGDIWAESKVNEGTTFTFTLPIPDSHEVSV